MTGQHFSWATYERLRWSHLGSLDDRMEAEWAEHREAKSRDGGHGDCEGWQFSPEDARLICSCGEVIATEGKWEGPMPDDLFATIGEKRRAMQDALIDAVLPLLIAERKIATDAKAFGELQDLIAGLELAARDLTNAVDDSPIASRPRNWSARPDGETA